MKSVTVNISFRKDLLESIDAAAKLESRTRSEFIREAARKYIGVSSGNNDDERTPLRAAERIAERSAERSARYVAKNKSCSYADYLSWPNEERWEIIDGVPYDMSPAPLRRHQEISMALSGEFYTYLKGKPCKVYAAPFDVRLPKDGEVEDRDITTVIQPDIAVVCKLERLDSRGCLKAPDLIVEILSPFTSSKDSVKKFDLYEREGVREYWVVRPDEQTVSVFMLGSDNRYGRPEMYTEYDKIKVGIFDSLVIDLQDIFRE
jgi:Uma2 family endonuclease